MAVKQGGCYIVISVTNLKLFWLCNTMTRNMIKNKLKRNLTDYVEHRESNKSGGYYLKRRG